MDEEQYEKLNEYLAEEFELIESKLKSIEDNLDGSKMEAMLSSITAKIANFEKNADRFDTMVKELNGSVTRCRALFNDKKNNAPLWYEMAKVQPPEIGPIWVKDMDGNQTMARCEGKAITYQSSEFFKYPVFWKPC